MTLPTNNPRDDFHRATGNGHHPEDAGRRIKIEHIGVLEMVIVLVLIMCILALIWSPFIINLFQP